MSHPLWRLFQIAPQIVQILFQQNMKLPPWLRGTNFRCQASYHGSASPSANLLWLHTIGFPVQLLSCLTKIKKRRVDPKGSLVNINIEVQEMPRKGKVGIVEDGAARRLSSLSWLHAIGFMGKCPSWSVDVNQK